MNTDLGKLQYQELMFISYWFNKKSFFQVILLSSKQKIVFENSLSSFFIVISQYLISELKITKDAQYLHRLSNNDTGSTTGMPHVALN